MWSAVWILWDMKGGGYFHWKPLYCQNTVYFLFNFSFRLKRQLMIAILSRMITIKVVHILVVRESFYLHISELEWEQVEFREIFIILKWIRVGFRWLDLNRSFEANESLNFYSVRSLKPLTEQLVQLFSICVKWRTNREF